MLVLLKPLLIQSSNLTLFEGVLVGLPVLLFISNLLLHVLRALFRVDAYLLFLVLFLCCVDLLLLEAELHVYTCGVDVFKVS